jgi:hypothetical protein
MKALWKMYAPDLVPEPPIMGGGGSSTGEVYVALQS